MCTGTTRTYFNMCARGAGTHGDVLNVHTGTCGVDTLVFQRVTHHTAHTPQHKTQHTTTHHNNTTTTPHENTDRDRERQRKKTETEKRREERREKRRERREKIHFQCGGAWPFLVVVVLCLVHPVKRDLRLLKKVRLHCSFISFSASWPVNSLLSAN